MNFLSFSGTVTVIEDFWSTPTDENGGCFQSISVDIGGGNLVNFVVAPNTYCIDHEVVAVTAV